MTWKSNQRIWIVISIVLMAFVSPASAKVIYVDVNAPGPTHDGSSWTNAYNYLQDAFASAVSGDEIWVAEGIYRPDEYTAHPYGTGDRTATFQLKNGVAIYGGFQGHIYTPPPPPPPMSLKILRTTAKDINQNIQQGIVTSANTRLDESDPDARDIELYETILSGDLNGNDTDAISAWDLWGDPTRYDNSFHVVTGSGADDTAVLDGFKISAGYADGTGIDNRGGGMFNDNGNPTMANCTFYANCGGGMYCEAGNPELTNCTFKMNITLGIGGGIDISNCSPTLIGCMFIANASHNGAGMSNRLSSPNLINCTFYANEAGSVGGAMCTDLSSPVMSNCTFRENTSGIIAGGMYFAGGNPKITNCVFIKNSALTSGGGVMVNSSTDLTLTNCTFSGNSAMSGSVMDNFHSTITLTNCILWDNLPPQIGDYNSTSVATYCDIQGGWPGLGNIDADPCFTDANNDDYHLRADSMCINAGDPNYIAVPNETDLDGKPRVIGGRIDMGVYEYQDLTIYVDGNAPGPINDGSSWTNAYKYLQDALADADSAAKPVEIRMAQGIYKPDQSSADPNGSGDQFATFQLINGVTLKGGYAGYGEPGPYARDIEFYETILSGDLNGDDLPTYPYNLDDNSYHIITGSGTEPNAVLDGLTISDGLGRGMYNYGGSPAVTNCTFSNNLGGNGGAMYNTHFSDPVVTNCKFSLNKAGENGGAMSNEDSNPVVTGCTFVDNSALRFGGAVYNDGSSPTFECCTFSENSAVSGGGGMYNNNSSPTLINCTFIRNSSGLFGGGLDTVMENSNPIVIGCSFIGNSADYSGGGTSNGTSSLTLINCIFIGNSAADKGGAMNNCAGRNINVNNCTFYGNQAPNGNLLALSCSQSNIQFTNCIMWDGGNEIWNNYDSKITIRYSDVYGGWPGLGNIDADPCFADANNGDYHLKSQAGRWDPNSESWVKDDVSSPCIDAGNPGCPEANEPMPNGNRRNMGAYGGTAEASKSPLYWRSIADMTNDWIVDSNDLKVFVNYWLQTGECIPGDFDRSQSVDFNDFAIFGRHWRQKGPGPGITYDIGGCIPVDFDSPAAGESDPTRFTVTVEGRYVYFEDMMRANCCPEELEVQMTVEGDLITIYEIERFFTRVPCPCLCDFPITATLGPFQPGIYILEVYQNNSFIGTKIVTIENG